MKFFPVVLCAAVAAAQQLTDPCASVRCPQACEVDAAGQAVCVSANVTDTCTPYTLQTEDCAKDQCYSSSLCSCQPMSYVRCADACSTAGTKCEAGFKCVSNYCGSCSFQCVKEGNTTTPVDTKPPAPTDKPTDKPACAQCFAAPCQVAKCDAGLVCEADDCACTHKCVKPAPMNTTAPTVHPCATLRCSMGCEVDAAGNAYCVQPSKNDTKPPTPTDKPACAQCFAAPCQVAKCDAGLVCEADDCACTHKCVKPAQNDTKPPTPATCTPYNESKMCIALAGWCYNPAKCECGDFGPLSDCDACKTAKCEDNYKCVSSGCGGCSHQCVKEDIPKPTDLPAKECKTASGELVKDGAVVRMDCNNCTCSNGMLMCTKMACPAPTDKPTDKPACAQCFAAPCQVAKCDAGLVCEADDCACTHKCVKPAQNDTKPSVTSGCTTDADCGASEWCRTAVLPTTNAFLECADFAVRECVKRVGVGASCNGFTLPCATDRCEEGLECPCADPTCDLPGKCQKPTDKPTPVQNTTAPAPCLQVRCKENPCNLADCAPGFTCKENYCGGCNFECVKEDIPKPTDLPAKECKTASGELVKDGAVVRMDCNNCTCSNGMLMCTKMACPAPTDKPTDKPACPQCFAAPCQVAKCDAGLVCEADDCACTHKCVKPAPMNTTAPTVHPCATLRCSMGCEVDAAGNAYCVQPSKNDTKPPTPTDKPACPQCFVAPCQVAKCDAGLVCEADDCACTHKCVKPAQNDTKPPTPATCTPYNESKMCIALAGWCYNPAKCECGDFGPLSDCDACKTAKCEDNYKCVSSGCGGCSHQCVKEDIPKPTDLPAKECKTASGELVKDGAVVRMDCNNCTCSNGMLMCTKMACPAPTDKPACAQCFAAPCQVAKCDAGLVCEADDCACTHKCVKPAQNDTKPPTPATCTPYNESKMCIALAGWCYNPAKCECGDFGPLSDCDACKTAKCEDNYKCVSSGCGGCSHQCVKEDIPKPTDLPAKECKTASGELVKDGAVVRMDCNNCTCSNGMLMCTKMACPAPTDKPACAQCFAAPCQVAKCDAGLVCEADDCACTHKCVKPAQNDTKPPVDGEDCKTSTGMIKHGTSGKVDCNTCRCSNGMLMCTQMYCPPTKEKSCKMDNGKTLKHNEITAVDCNTCTCMDGDLMCTEMACVKSCTLENGEVVKEGERFKKDCNTCWCNGGKVGCTEMACGAPTNYTCDEARTLAPWTHEQRLWCCENKKQGCTVVQDKREKCMAADKSGATVDAVFKADCCNSSNVMCPEPKFADCSAPKDDEREWCCRVMQKGCTMTCDAQKMDLVQATYCCNTFGSKCTDDYKHEQKTLDKQELKKAAKKVWKQIKQDVKGAIEDIFENPKAVLRRIRMTLFRGSATLAQNPQNLVVTLIAAYTKDGQMPPTDVADQWRVEIPHSWNEDNHAEEHAVVADKSWSTSGASDARAAVVLQSGDSDQKYYFEYRVEGTDEQVGQSVAEMEESVGSGKLADNSGGMTVPVGSTMPIAVTGASDKPEESSEGSDSGMGWLFAVIGSLGALCMGGLVAFVLFQRKQRQQAENELFIGQMEDLSPSMLGSESAPMRECGSV